MDEKVIHEVKELQSQEAYKNEGPAFVAWYLKNIEEYPEAEFTDVITDGGGDLGVDAIIFDEKNKQVVIYQGKFSDSVEGSPVSLEEISKTFETVTELKAGRVSKGNRHVVSKLKAAVTRVKGEDDQWEVKVRLLTNKEFSPAVIDRYKSRVDVDLIDLDSIIQSIDPSTIKSPRINAEIKYVPGQCFETSQATGRVLVCTVDAKELAKLFRGHGKSLFWRNVRFSLGNKPVNKGMAATLQKVAEKKYFWLFNNGVTILCDQITLDETHSSIELKNLSIINGAQTTSTLYEQGAHLDDSVQVLIKIIETEAASEEVIGEIVKFTNKQTATISQDFASNDPRHAALFPQFASQGYFYDYKRGLWESARPGEKDDKQRLRIADLAYAMIAFGGQPGAARNDKRNFFERDAAYYDNVFNDSRSIPEYLFVYDFFELIKKRVKELRKEHPENGFGYQTPFFVSIAGVVYRTLIQPTKTFQEVYESNAKDTLMRDLLDSTEVIARQLLKDERKRDPSLDIDNLTKSNRVNEVILSANEEILPEHRRAIMADLEKI